MEEDLNRHFTKEETQIMANKYIKGCLTILTNRKIEIKPNEGIFGTLNL